MQQTKKVPELPIFLKCMKISFMCFIIYPSPEHEVYQKIHYWVFVLYDIVYTISAYLIFFFTQTTTSQQKLNVLLQIFAGSIIPVIILLNHWNRGMFLKCYKNALLFTNNNETQPIADRIMTKKCSYIVILLIVQPIGMLIFPIFLLIVTDTPRGGDMTLPFLQAHLYDHTTPLGYVGALLQEDFLLVSVLIAFAGIAVNQLVHYAIIDSHYQVLDRKIKELDDKTTFRRENSIRDEKADVEDLMEIIQYHRMMTTIIDDFIKAVELTISMLISCFFLSAVIIIAIITINPKDYLRNMETFNKATLLCHFTILCYIGEYFLHLNDDLRIQLYGTNWHQQSIAYKKHFYTFFLLLERPFIINFFGKYAVNYELLMSVVRKIYMTVQFILLMKQRGAL